MTKLIIFTFSLALPSMAAGAEAPLKLYQTACVRRVLETAANTFEERLQSLEQGIKYYGYLEDMDEPLNKTAARLCRLFGDATERAKAATQHTN